MALSKLFEKCLTLQKYTHKWPVWVLSRRCVYTLDPIDPNEPTFNKILIANRGEIACRIISTAKKMNIKTVAVYSVADAQARHVKLADESVFIGPSIAAQSYINMDKVLEAVQLTGADAVHPGYGFLSENPTFVAKLEERQISFIGPSSAAIVGMGDKLESKRLAMAAGVSTIPGYDGVVEDADHCVKIAQEIGYPVMIKASAGGGGKGMRIARNDNDARDGFKLSTDEAAASFGDSRMLVEKFIDKPRHIEIQVLGDKHGNAIYLNERECSIQRRNQKVIEEAPSVFLDEATRRAMGTQAVTLCRSLAYSSAGTVEFLVDSARNFYFLEMNTRLQVEHPITESITGIDLVHQMIRSAKGHPLNITQDDVKINGWAIESRVYAEDPYKNFGMPSIGRLHRYVEPTHLEGVRCDNGIEEGSDISFYYDPMISKLVCSGKDRNEAIERSIQALDYYVIRGVTHNIPLLRDILTEERFRSGDISTNYLPETYPEGFQGHTLTALESNHVHVIVGAIYGANELRNQHILNGPRCDIHAKLWHKWHIVATLHGKDTEMRIKQINNSFEIEVNGELYKINKNDINLASALIETSIDKRRVVMQLNQRNASGDYKITYMGTTYALRVFSKQAADLLHLMPEKAALDVSKVVAAPMPGMVKSVAVRVGDEVVEGQELCVIEAMKMQNAMVALASGTIKAVQIKEGDTVSDGDVLIELE